MQLPTPDDVLEARTRIAPHVLHTPMLQHRRLDEITGATILIKPESLQRTGSFKLRGATNAIRRLDGESLTAGVATFSSGNHGQATACAAAAVGANATVFMPADAPRIKMDSTRAWGAHIVEYDRLVADRQALAAAFVDATGAVLIPPYDHPDVIAGQGTAALELIEDARLAGLAIDSLLVCTGGGGLVAGSALAVEARSPGTHVYACEPEDWDDTRRSLASGSRETVQGSSLLCDSLLSPMPGELTFAINQPRLAGGLVVSDGEVMAAIAFAFAHLKLVVEPGGAVALAALLAGKIDARGQVIGVVISGGNVDPAVFKRALAT